MSQEQGPRLTRKDILPILGVIAAGIIWYVVTHPEQVRSLLSAIMSGK